jgi:tetratricopeptide (TPR) repeat protein
MEIVLRASALRKQDESPKGRLAARKLYQEALRQDPASVPAMEGILGTIEDELEHDSSADQERLLKEMDGLSLRAVQADRNNPLVWGWRAVALQWQERWDAAIDAGAEAMRIDPYRNDALGMQAWLLIFSGRGEEALSVLDRAIALDPQRPDTWFIYGQCEAHTSLGRYDDAIASCGKLVALTDEWYGHVFLIGLYAQKGDMAKAVAERAAALKLDPDLSIARLKALRLWRNPVFLAQLEAHLFAGLRKAGIPEQ